MLSGERDIAMARFHPAVLLVYICAVLISCMAVLQPVVIALCLLAAIVYHVAWRGWQATLRALLWQLPLFLLIAVLNPLFVNEGSTVLLSVAGCSVTRESVAYGACMGGMLAAVVLWLSAFSQVFGANGMRELLGSRFPATATLTSLSMRLFPRLLREGRAIGGVQKACTAASGGGLATTVPGSPSTTGRRSATRFRLRQITALMGLAMEDSVATADSMRARGWGSGTRRTSYLRLHMRPADWGALAVVLAICGTWAPLAASLGSSFAFYPTLGVLAPWWSYGPLALLLALPGICDLVGGAR